MTLHTGKFHTLVSSEPPKISKNWPNLNGTFEQNVVQGDLTGSLHDILRCFLSENIALFWNFT